MDSLLHLIGIAFVIEHERMDISVSCVKDVGNAQPVLGAGFGNKFHYFRELRPGHHSILCQIIWTETADRSEGTLARLPEESAFFFCVRQPNITRAILAANFHNLFGLTLKPRGQTIQFNDKDRTSIQGKTELVSG